MSTEHLQQEVRWLELLVSEVKRLALAHHPRASDHDGGVARAIGNLEDELAAARSRLSRTAP
jgi:hypothetical protein